MSTTFYVCTFCVLPLLKLWPWEPRVPSACEW